MCIVPLYYRLKHFSPCRLFRMFGSMVRNPLLRQIFGFTLGQYVRYSTLHMYLHPHRRALKKYLQYGTVSTLDENPGGRVVQGGEYPELCTPGGGLFGLGGGTNLPL